MITLTDNFSENFNTINRELSDKSISYQEKAEDVTELTLWLNEKCKNYSKQPAYKKVIEKLKALEKEEFKD